MRRPLETALVAMLLLFPAAASAQPSLDFGKIVETLETNGRVELDEIGVRLVAYGYTVDGDAVEAIAFRPAADGPHPGLLLIPGYSRTARDYVPMGIRFAREGYACIAVTQRGFGRSSGEADFVGPKTIAALEAGFRKFAKEPYVDAARMGIFGYSRGGMAASLLAVRLRPEEIKAAVLAAGIYDFKKAHDDIRIEGIRANMEKEAGLSDAAVTVRTSLTKMSSLACPVLILHGEKDENVPVSQAYLLRDELTELKKEFHLRTFPDREHDIGRENIYDSALPFFRRTLAPSPAPAK